MASNDRTPVHQVGSRLEVVVRAIAASQAGGGIAAIAPFFDDDVVWTGVLPGMVCNGKAEVLAIIGRHPWPGRLTALSIRESGDVVAVHIEGPDVPEIEGHARSDARALRFTFAGDRVTRIDSVTDPDAAFERPGS